MALTEVDAARLNDNVFNTVGPFKNRIINGDMRFDQRNAGASVTPTTLAYTVDRWMAAEQTDGAMTVQQSSTAPNGFNNSLLTTITVPDNTLAATQYAVLLQKIEGYNVADLNWGSASAQSITVSFKVRSSLTGTFGGAIQNSAQDRSYPFTYTINTANTFEDKTITIPGDTTGTWLKDADVGLNLFFGLGVGSTYSGTSGSWASANYFSATGATNVVGTNGATFYITGVQLEVGSVATPFERRSYGQELALCQRYYYQIGGNTFNNPTSALYGIFGSGITYTTSQADISIPLKVSMRSTPTLSQGTAAVQQGANVYAATSISDAGSTPNVIFARVGIGTASLTAGGGANYFANNSATGFFAAASEL